MRNPEIYRGVHVVTVTPLTSEGGVDPDATARLLEFLIVNGVHGIVPLGSTGEFFMLPEAERRRMAEITVATVGGRVPVFIGASGNSTTETIKFCRHAKEAGATGVMLLPPSGHALSDDEAYTHFMSIADAVDIPIMLYNNTRATRIDLTPSLVHRLSQHPNIEAIKESSGDVRRVPEILARCGDAISVLGGFDNVMLEVFLTGAVGWVSGPANLAPHACVQFYHSVARGDWNEARRRYYDLLPLLKLIQEGPYIQLIKEGLAFLGLPVGPATPPLLPLPSGYQKELRSVITKMGLRANGICGNSK